jgi:hypothetical protein
LFTGSFQGFGGVFSESFGRIETFLERECGFGGWEIVYRWVVFISEFFSVIFKCFKNRKVRILGI